MLEVASVHKYFTTGDTRREILHSVSLSLPSGKSGAIVGPSGSGKSTLLNIMAGLERADGGEVRIGGTSLSSLTAEQAAEFRLKEVGIVFQFFNLLPTLTLLENVLIPAHLLGTPIAAARKRAVELLDRLQVGSALHRLPHEVSGGELQRAALARALMNNPKILFADEPTGNLDQANGERMLEIFRELVVKDQITVLVVTHDPRIEAQADYVFRMNDGRLHEERR